MTPERAEMLKAKAEAKKRAWSLAGHAKRQAALAERAVAEGREPGKLGGVKRFSAEELRQHQRDRDARRDPTEKRASAKASMARLYARDPQRFIDRTRERELKLLAQTPEIVRMSQAARRAAYRVRQMGGVSARGMTAVVMRLWVASEGCCAACAQSADLELDHKLALINGGSNREKNLQILGTACCRPAKDRADVAEKSRVYKKAVKHAGFKSRKGWRPMPGTRAMASMLRMPSGLSISTLSTVMRFIASLNSPAGILR